MMSARLFCFGLGFSARHVIARLPGWTVAGSVTRPEGLAALAADAIDAVAFSDDHPLPPDALTEATHLLLSIPPGTGGDPVLRRCERELEEAAPGVKWIGYLSTTGVYGDHAGAWVDETTPPSPSSERSHRRAAAEQDWLDFGRQHQIPTQIFRLAGIYGPGRSVLDDVRAGRAQAIDRPGHLFSRIHVEDIATAVVAGMSRPEAGPIFNVCDDEPAASADVVRFACGLLGVAPPVAIPFEQARLSPMAQSFWADNKRVRNDLMKQALGVSLRFPTYREGLRAILESEGQV
jgi:nucleoside-diphosphate-sugar epimerase